MIRKIKNSKRANLLLIILLIVTVAITFSACENLPSIESITINYYSEGVLEFSQTLDGGLPTPPTLEKEGYELIGWYLDADFDEEFDITAALAGTINVYAKWSEDAQAEVYTVTYIDWDDAVLKTEEVTASDAPTPPTPTRTGYDFTGWSVDITNIQSDIVVRAEYTIKSFTVVFKNYDDTVLKTQTVTYGSDAAPPSNPSKEDAHSNTYVFMGWEGNYSNVTADLIIIAQFDIVEGQFATVTFIQPDGTVLKAQTVEVGSDATPPTNPSKAETAQYRYEFSGWNNSYDNVAADITVTAQYIEILREYTVTFMDGDIVVDEVTVNYGEDAILPPDRDNTETVSHNIVFSGWDSDGENIQEDTVINAVYSQQLKTFLVKFFADEEMTELLAEQTIEYGEAATEPTFTPLTGYNFVSWSDDFDDIKESVNIYAVTAIKTFTVKFYVGETVYAQQTVNYDGNASAPSAPSIEANQEYSYNFIGWDKSFEGITSNIDVYAEFEPVLVEYTVTFYSTGAMTDIIVAVTVNYNMDAEAPAYTPPVGYDFVEWSDVITNIEENMAVYPILAIKSYNVTFKNGEDTLSTQSVQHGASATPPSNPQKAEDNYYTYEFSGWDKSADNILGDTVINAEYEFFDKYYTVVFKDYNGTTISTETVKAGEDANAPEPIPPFDGYHLAKWVEEGDITGVEASTKHIISDYTLKAVYEINKYNVLFFDYNGALLKEELITHGQGTTAPTLSEKAGFAPLVGGDADWDSVAVNVTNDMTITAIRIPINYKDEPEEVDCSVIIYNDLDEYVGAYLSLEAAITAALSGNKVVVIDTITLNDDLTISSGIKVILKNDNELLTELLSDVTDYYDLEFFDYDTLEMDSLVEINGSGTLTFEDGAEVEESVFFIVDYEKEGGHGAELLDYLLGEVSPVPSVFPYFPFDSYSLNGIKTDLIINYGAIYNIAPVFIVVNFMVDLVPFLPVNDFINVEVKPLVSSDKEGNSDGLLLLNEGAVFSKKYDAGRVIVELVGNATTGDFSTKISHGEDSSFASQFKGLDTPIVIDSFPFVVKGTVDLIMTGACVEIESEITFAEGATLFVDKDSILVINNLVISGDNAITIDGVLEIASLGAVEGNLIAGADGATIRVNSEQDDLFGGAVLFGTVFVANGGVWVEQ